MLNGAVALLPFREALNLDLLDSQSVDQLARCDRHEE
jgi:hypothetical protein